MRGSAHSVDFPLVPRTASLQQMPRPALSSTPAARRQNLLVEFASLKYAAPQGVYLSLSLNPPQTWHGVIFVRKGPYRGGIFKFTLSFSDTYPSAAPLIIFHTSIYHPLIAALVPSSHTPGVFSLKHGFPHWFSAAAEVRRETTALEVIRYVKASLDDASVLDSIPLSACENPAAWRAWSVGEAGRKATGGWDEMVRVAVEGSMSEGVLFAGRGGDEIIRFVDVNAETLKAVEEEIKKAVEEREGC